MANLGKLNNKLKSAIKRWPSFTKLSRPLHSPAGVANSHDEYDDINNEDRNKVFSKKEVYEVYVGKSRRRYVLGSHIIGHPLFQELIDRSSSGAGGNDGDGDDDDHRHHEQVVVACEVVLFEHLLWMLESDAAAGGCFDASQSHAMHELADFYFTS